MKTNFKKTSVIKEEAHGASGTSDMRDAKEPSPIFEGGAQPNQHKPQFLSLSKMLILAWMRRPINSRRH